MLILIREYHLFLGQAPVDSQRWIVPSYGTFSLRCIKVVAFILENHLLAQHTEAMRKATWNEELTMIILRQFHGYVLAKGGRAFTDVHGHVEHSTLDDAHQFALGKRRFLKMQAAEHAVRRLALVVLHKMNGAHFFIKLSL